MSKTKIGIITNIRDDFGFIHCQDDGNDYFFHKTKMKEGESLSKGVIVEFELSDHTPKGKDLPPVSALWKKSVESKVKSSNVSKKLRYSFKDSSDIEQSLFKTVSKLSKMLANFEKSYNDPEYIKERLLGLRKSWENLTEISHNEINVDIINNSFKNSLSQIPEELRDWAREFDLQAFGSELEEITSLPPDKGSKKSYAIIWGEWRDKKRQTFYSGYDEGFFNHSFLNPGESDAISVYDLPPPKAEWDLIEINQKGKVFYLSSAPVNQISQASAVPSIPPVLGEVEAAERVLDKDRGKSEWQRIVDISRLRKIQNFINFQDNIIANSIMLFVNDPDCIDISQKTLTIDFDKFLKKENEGEHKGRYVDRVEKEKKDKFGNKVFEDYRPFWIIDGQHRVRGIQKSDEMNSIKVPLVIFPHDFKPGQTAKLFAEINTLQKPLDNLHELFMQHRFSIDSTNVKRKFIDYRSITLEQASKKGLDQDWLHSRANHLAYETLAKLTRSGPLKGRVRFLPQNKDSQNFFVSADQWVNYARSWFTSFGCYGYNNDDIHLYVNNPSDSEKAMNIDDIFFEEVKNYFTAWVETSNHNDWDDSKPRWPLKGNKKALLQKKTFFIILVEIFPLVRELAFSKKTESGGSGIISIEEFKNTLEPFKWVDWTDKELEVAFPGSGEKGRRSLEAWLSDALLHQKQYVKESVMDRTLCSLPGRGINAPLAEPKLEILSDVEWPTKDNQLIITSKRPYNARYDAAWEIKNQNDDIIISKKSGTKRHSMPEYAELKIDHSDIKGKDCEILNVRVDWENAQSINTGHKTIILKKKID